MVSLISYVANAIKNNMQAGADNRNKVQDAVNSYGQGEGGMQYGQAPDLQKTDITPSRVASDIGGMGMAYQGARNDNGPLSSFFKMEEDAMSPTTHQAKGATAKGQTVDDIKKMLFGNNGGY